MTIKIAILKTGEQVISDIKEVASEEKFRGYLFVNPQTVTISTDKTLLTEEVKDQEAVQIILSSWIPLTEDKQIYVAPEFVVAMVEPIEIVKNIYVQKVEEKNV